MNDIECTYVVHIIREVDVYSARLRGHKGGHSNINLHTAPVCFYQGPTSRSTVSQQQYDNSGCSRGHQQQQQ